VVFGAASLNPAGATTTWYTSVTGGANQTTNGPEYAGIAMPIACSFKALNMSARYISLTGSNTITVTLVKNGVDQALTCSLTALTLGNTYSCSATGTIPVVVGDFVALKYTQTNTTPTIRLGVGTTCE
jgi:hypothetical protein